MFLQNCVQEHYAIQSRSDGVAVSMILVQLAIIFHIIIHDKFYIFIVASLFHIIFAVFIHDIVSSTDKFYSKFQLTWNIQLGSEKSKIVLK